MSGRYINPYTDFGFKYLFGTEPNKDITLELVNALLQGKEVIKSLTLLPTEQLGDTKDDRRSVFDIYCENEQALQERIFKKFFDVAEIAALSKEEYAKYWESEKVYYDNDGAIRTAEAKGRAKERLANAKALLGNGVPLEVIVKSLQLTDDEAAILRL